MPDVSASQYFRNKITSYTPPPPPPTLPTTPPPTRVLWEDKKSSVGRRFQIDVAVFNEGVGPVLDRLVNLLTAAIAAHNAGNPIPAGNLAARQQRISIVNTIVANYIRICYAQAGVQFGNDAQLKALNNGWWELKDHLSGISSTMTQFSQFAY